MDRAKLIETYKATGSIYQAGKAIGIGYSKAKVILRNAGALGVTADVSMPEKKDDDLGARLTEILKEVMPESPINEDVVREIVREEMKPRRVIVQDGTVEREIEGVVPPEFARILKNLKVGNNPYLVGPPGCGKTTVARMAAQALGRDFAFISLTQGMSEGKLIGFVDAMGKYHETQFVKTYRDGGVFLFDEMDAADSNVLLVVNAALENGHIALPNGETIAKHKDFAAIAGANTDGKGATRAHSGRSVIDGATMERFIMVRMGFSDEVEEKIVHAEVLALGRKIRKALIERGVKTPIISTRRMVQATRLVDTGDDPKSALLEVLEGNNDDNMKIIREAI